MSKIGKQPVTIKEGVTITFDKSTVTVTGPKGSLSYTMPEQIEATVEDGKVMVLPKTNTEGLSKEAKRGMKHIDSLFGVVRAIVSNMVHGVSTGFEKKLELTGVGYRAQVTGNDLTLSLGFSHPVKVQAIPGISFKVAENTIVVSGIDKSLVGDMASKIRAIRPPEPYKGKGISYSGERIRRKAGKAAKAVGAK